jgi:hypothetical protein
MPWWLPPPKRSTCLSLCVDRMLPEPLTRVQVMFDVVMFDVAVVPGAGSTQRAPSPPAIAFVAGRARRDRAAVRAASPPVPLALSCTCMATRRVIHSCPYATVTHAHLPFPAVQHFCPRRESYKALEPVSARGGESSNRGSGLK